MRYGLLGMKLFYAMFRNVFSKNVSKIAVKDVKKKKKEEKKSVQFDSSKT